MKETEKQRLQSLLFWLARYAIVASAAFVFWGLTWCGLELAAWSTETNLSVALWTVRVIMWVIIVIGVCIVIAGLLYLDLDSIYAGVVIAVVPAVCWWGAEEVLPNYALNNTQVMVISLIVGGLALIGYTLNASIPASPRDRIDQGEVAITGFVVDIVLAIFFVVFSFIPGLAVWISTL